MLKYIIVTDRGNYEASGLNVNEAREQVEREHPGCFINETLTEAQAKKRRIKVSG